MKMTYVEKKLKNQMKELARTTDIMGYARYYGLEADQFTAIGEFEDEYTDPSGAVLRTVGIAYKYTPKNTPTYKSTLYSSALLATENIEEVIIKGDRFIAYTEDGREVNGNAVDFVENFDAVWVDSIRQLILYRTSKSYDMLRAAVTNISII